MNETEQGKEFLTYNAKKRSSDASSYYLMIRYDDIPKKYGFTEVFSSLLTGKSGNHYVSVIHHEEGAVVLMRSNRYGNDQSEIWTIHDPLSDNRTKAKKGLEAFAREHNFALSVVERLEEKSK